jgi:hypothetical protein
MSSTALTLCINLLIISQVESYTATAFCLDTPGVITLLKQREWEAWDSAHTEAGIEWLSR